PGAKGGLMLRELCNAYIKSKHIKLDAGQLSPRSFVDYDHACRVLLDEFGPTKKVLDLRPKDFEKLYSRLSRKHGVSTLGREIIATRSLFKYAFESDMIERPVKFGPTFCGPSKQDLRKAKSKAQQANGKNLFAAEEIRRLLDAASPGLKAMIFLGINGGLGNSDCSSLPLSALDLDAGWLDYARVKTGVNRKIPLWSETITALRQVISTRRLPADDADADLVFLTKFGLRWVRDGFEETKKLGKTIIKSKTDNQLAKTFGKLLDELDLRRRGIGFYALRHTFETIAGRSKDQVAVDAVMGHVDSSMAAEYRHGIDENRLKAVVDHVHNWLYHQSREENKKI
ncbi:MAG: tyrosine-type recombinase/integrase, partial [Thermoguttaceae bacterium]